MGLLLYSLFLPPQRRGEGTSASGAKERREPSNFQATLEVFNQKILSITFSYFVNSREGVFTQFLMGLA